MHRKIAERRVKLALLFDEIGRKEDVEVSEQEMTEAVMAQARNYPGQEREFINYIRNTPSALGQIRAPIFEDKVVELILSRVSITETPVSRDALQAEVDALDDE